MERIKEAIALCLEFKENLDDSLQSYLNLSLRLFRGKFSSSFKMGFHGKKFSSSISSRE